MADAAFILPKGIYDKYKAMMAALKMDIVISQDDPNQDVIAMSQAADSELQDFLDLVEVMRLHICRSENLMADTGGVGRAWIFHK